MVLNQIVVCYFLTSVYILIYHVDVQTMHRTVEAILDCACAAPGSLIFTISVGRRFYPCLEYCWDGHTGSSSTNNSERVDISPKLLGRL